MTVIPEKHLGLRVPWPIYEALLEVTGSEPAQGRKGKISPKIREYIFKGLKNDGIKIEELKGTEAHEAPA